MFLLLYFKPHSSRFPFCPDTPEALPQPHATEVILRRAAGICSWWQESLLHNYQRVTITTECWYIRLEDQETSVAPQSTGIPPAYNILHTCKQQRTQDRTVEVQGPGTRNGWMNLLTKSLASAPQTSGTLHTCTSHQNYRLLQITWGNTGMVLLNLQGSKVNYTITKDKWVF